MWKKAEVHSMPDLLAAAPSQSFPVDGCGRKRKVALYPPPRRVY